MPVYKVEKELENLANTIIAEHRPNLNLIKIGYHAKFDTTFA